MAEAEKKIAVRNFAHYSINLLRKFSHTKIHNAAFCTLNLLKEYFLTNYHTMLRTQKYTGSSLHSAAPSQCVDSKENHNKLIPTPANVF
jgi:hypothetical protein